MDMFRCGTPELRLLAVYSEVATFVAVIISTSTLINLSSLFWACLRSASHCVSHFYDDIRLCNVFAELCHYHFVVRSLDPA